MNNLATLKAFTKQQWAVAGDPIQVFWPQVIAKRLELGVSEASLFAIVEELTAV